LSAAGHQLSADPGRSTPAAIEAALCAFQRDRGLPVSGTCDDPTWHALVEAGWRLGDRVLTLTAPNQRGDDVADLQARLHRLGFDCGRVDGIFGAETAVALHDFQRNCGLLVDGVCGAATVRSLVRVSSQSGDGPGVALVRERDRYQRETRSMAASRIAVATSGTAGQLARDLGRSLRRHGASVAVLDELDPSAQAAAANRFSADLVICVDMVREPNVVLHHYGVPAFESVAGRALVDGLRSALGELAGELGAGEVSASAQRHPLLRETRMPAVRCQLGPPAAVALHSPRVIDQITHAIVDWTSGRP